MKYRYFKIIALFLIYSYSATAQERILNTNQSVFIETDKAAYTPGEKVQFTLTGELPANASVKLYHLDEVIAQQKLSAKTWQWIAPSDDYKGYLTKVYTVKNGKEKTLATIAVDVSSNWSRFPRYGFLSKYQQMNDTDINTVVKDLNRYHINGLQFYDWHYKHHQPLAGTAQKPDSVWVDIANRPTYFKTVENYITAAHQYNMKAMFYNLVYGALKNAEADGVKDQWYMYDDKDHKVKQKFGLPDNFNSDIFFTDPANKDWQQYITDQNKKVYAALDFDGYHMDQVGNRDKPLYDYEGKELALDKNFEPFINGVKALEPQKSVVMNAVNQYGQEGIAKTPVDFIYTEVWPPNDDFTALAKTVTDNDRYSNYTKRTVLAAYMNYDKAESKGEFNTPSILLADAVIFAYGGSHLELGEHMLCKEYFPNSNLSMRPDLKNALVNYYDFMVAYENLLRDGHEFNDIAITGDSGLKFNNQLVQGEIAAVGKQVGDRQIIHLLNFKTAATMSWRDNKGIQTEPELIKAFNVDVKVKKAIKKIWYASPDAGNGLPVILSFKQNKDNVSISIPQLKYWDMLVIEY